MLTSAENDLLTRVGAGQPAGELLRRYWLPVGIASELTAENPTQAVKILGETLVLFRDKSGRIGLLDDRCSHRGISLCYGRVEERGMSCAYHPLGVVRDPNQNATMIDTHLNQTIQQFGLVGADQAVNG